MTPDELLLWMLCDPDEGPRLIAAGIESGELHEMPRLIGPFFHKSTETHPEKFRILQFKG